MSGLVTGRGRALSLGTEVRRQAARRRTRIVLALVAVLPLLVAGAFTLGGDDDSAGGAPSAPTLVDLATSGSLNFALFVLLAAGGFLLGIVVALFAGDSVASEATWSTLRYLLAAPVARSRLLAVKLVVALLSGALAVAVLVLAALGVGAVFYGWSDLTTITGTTLAPGTALARLALSAASVCASLLWVACLAFFLGTRTDAALGAVGGAVLAIIVSQILDSITALGGLRVWLPTHDSFAWLGAFDPVVDGSDMLRGALVSLSWSVPALVAAWWHFTRKDVVS